VTTFLENTAQEIDRRLQELRREVALLEAASEALRADSGEPAARRGPTRRVSSSAGPEPSAHTPTRRRRPAARTRTRASSSTGSSPQRGRRSGARASRALEIVRQRPGITVNELAQEMKIQPNYLYRVLPKLASDGLIKREGRGWHPSP
jgi:hypothetical protein